MMEPIETWISSILSAFDLKIRCVVVGDEGVGKSSLVRCYVDMKMSDGPQCVQKEPSPLQGQHSFLITLRDDIVAKVGLWDTKMNQLMRLPKSAQSLDLLSQSYFRHTAGVIICYDITRLDSFEHAMYYYRQARRHFFLLSGAIFLVGCKADLEQYRQVPKELARETAREYGMAFFETSAVTGQNVAYITHLPREVFHRLEQHDLWLDPEYNGVRLETTLKRLASSPRLKAIWKKSLDEQRKEIAIRARVAREEAALLGIMNPPNATEPESVVNGQPPASRRQRHLSCLQPHGVDMAAVEPLDNGSHFSRLEPYPETQE